MARRRGLTFYQRKKQWNMGLIHEVFQWMIMLVATVVVAIVVVLCMGKATSVIGSSMEPALFNGQDVFLNQIIYKVSSPKRGDVIVFQPNGNEKSHYYVKRVVGTPGDSLKIANGVLYVNGEAYNRYLNDKIADSGILEEEIILGKNEYFVMGDNCNNGEDSRSVSIGAIKKEHIIGKVWFKFAAQSSGVGFVN